MRNYIIEKALSPPLSFRFGGVDVDEYEKMPEFIDTKGCFSTIEKIFPSHYYKDLQNIQIAHRKEFEERNITALYDEGVLYLN